MKHATALGGLLALVLMSSLSCADQQNNWQKLRKANVLNSASAHGHLLVQDTVTVIDSANHPVANATVLLGYEINNPFKGNQLTTDASGVTAIPADWKAALPLTVQAPGFVTTTIPVAMPGSMIVQINRQEGQGEIEIKGTTTGFGRLITDGKVDFGLVIPALSRQQMLSFDLASVISPKNDTITIIGNDIDIPTNITLPDQSETYIFPIEFNKPDYRLYVRDPGQFQLFAAHGQFPLQRVVNDVRAGKSMFELINYFTFFGGGQRQVTATGNVTGQDVAVDQIAFKDQTNVKAPTFPDNQIMVSLALTENGDLLMPTDLKRLTSGQAMNLKTSGATPTVLSLMLENAPTNGMPNASEEMFNPIDVAVQYYNLFAKVAGVQANVAQDFSRMSFSILPAAGGVSPQFLSLTDKPSFNNYVLKMKPPTLPTGLSEVATYMVLSEVETISTGKVQTERRTRLWEVWSGAWLTQTELPKIAINRSANRKYRWEVMFLARPTNLVPEANGAAVNNLVDLKTITHVTRNALDI